MAHVGILRALEGGRLGFQCPGCGSMHVVNVNPATSPCWGFNGDYERPTFAPSVLVRWGHHVPGVGGRGSGAHCQYGCDDPEDGSPACCGVCHSFVTNGQIQFLGDCTHALAGQTFPLTSDEA